MLLENEILTASTPEARSMELQLPLLQKSALVLRALNHPLRQQMLSLLHTHGHLTVTELYTKLRLEQSVASQHLAILRKAGFVNTTRDGKFIFYSVNQQRLDEVHQFCYSLLGR